MASHGLLLSSPRETPGIDRTGASAAWRVIWRRDNSMLKLLASSTTVLISSSSQGSFTGSQS
jgi:hypothetical protein